MTNAIIHSTFAEISDLENSVVDHLGKTVLFAQVRDHFVFNEPLHLERNAWEANCYAALGFHNECRSRSVGVLHHYGPARDLRLPFVVLGEDESSLLEAFTKLFE